MIPGILNTILAFVLVYMSILRLEVLETHLWTILLSGVLIIVFGAWSRAGDAMRWFSTVNIVLGITLLLFGIWHWVAPFAHLFVFWFVFWTGILLGVIALWGAIHRPRPSVPSAAAERITAGRA